MPDRQGARLVQLAGSDRWPDRVGVAVDDGRDSDRVVVVQQLDQPPALISLRRLAARGRHLDVSGAVAEDAGRLAGAWVLFDFPWPVDAEILVDAAELERQRVDRGIGPGREQHRIVGRGPVQLVPGRVSLLLEPGDEDLADDDPSAGPECLGPRSGYNSSTSSIVSISGIGWSNSVMQASVGWVCESIRPGRTILPCEVDQRRARPARFQDVLIGADPDQPVALDGQGLADREIAIGRDDLAVMEDQVGV